MIYSDLVKNNNNDGIYTELFKNKNFNLPIINEVVTPAFLDTAFFFRNSLKTVNVGIPDIKTACVIIIATYYDKWKTYLNAILNDNFKNGVGTITETTSNGNASNKNQVSAFDSSELVDDSGTNQTSANTTTTKTTDIDKVNSMLNLYQKYSVYAMIETDIKHVLFSRVYYDERTY